MKVLLNTFVITAAASIPVCIGMAFYTGNDYWFAPAVVFFILFMAG